MDLLVTSTFLLGRPAPTTVERILQVGYTAAGVVILLARRRAPAVVLAATCAHAVLGRLFLTGVHSTLTLFVALTALAERRRPAVSIAGVAAVLIPVAAEIYVTDRDILSPDVDPAARMTELAGMASVWLAFIAIAWAYGRWLGRNSRHIDHLEAERDRQRVLAEQAVATERARIARELHDIVSNAVTVMVLHAAGARRVVRGDPLRAEQALATIEGAGTQAMGELRRLLGVLRDSGVASADGSAGPAAGLAELDTVVRHVRSTGVEVCTEVQGAPETLDPSVDLAAYRVVQEALTNVAKHSGPGASATVRLDWNPAWLDVHVDDDGAGRLGGRSAGQLSTGHGLLGLRERLGVVGGTLSVGPGDTGGYRVLARLPVAPQQAESQPPESQPPESRPSESRPSESPPPESQPADSAPADEVVAAPA